MKLNTTCPHCNKPTTFKHYNAPHFWYCNFCSQDLPLQDLSQLNAINRDTCKKSYPQATHYIKINNNDNLEEDYLLYEHENFLGLTKK